MLVLIGRRKFWRRKLIDKILEILRELLSLILRLPDAKRLPQGGQIVLETFFGFGTRFRCLLQAVLGDVRESALRLKLVYAFKNYNDNTGGRVSRFDRRRHLRRSSGST